MIVRSEDRFCALNHVQQMTSLSLINETSQTCFNISKSAAFSTYMLDIPDSRELDTPSNRSTYDSESTKLEEESLDFAKIEEVSPGQRLTLGDIVAKRGYSKKQDSIKKRTRVNTETKGDRTSKKLKLDDKTDHKVMILEESVSYFPEVVIREGKVQVIENAIKIRGSAVKEIEVVGSLETKMTTSASFKKKIQGDRWTEIETEKFYRALELFGTDFSIIAKVFKNRNRNQIKNKFLREEKIALEKVNAALKGVGFQGYSVLLDEVNKNKKENKVIFNENDNKVNLIDMAIIQDLSDAFIPQKIMLK